MNEQTAKLLEQLAAKLGTTSEYLWSVLLKQAPVHATATLIQILAILLAGFGLYKANKHFSDDENDVSYYKLEMGLGFPMIIATLVWLILFFCGVFAMDEVIAGFFNPEFWALDYILDKLSK